VPEHASIPAPPCLDSTKASAPLKVLVVCSLICPTLLCCLCYLPLLLCVEQRAYQNCVEIMPLFLTLLVLGGFQVREHLVWPLPSSCLLAYEEFPSIPCALSGLQATHLHSHAAHALSSSPLVLPFAASKTECCPRCGIHPGALCLLLWVHVGRSQRAHAWNVSVILTAICSRLFTHYPPCARLGLIVEHGLTLGLLSLLLASSEGPAAFLARPIPFCRMWVGIIFFLCATTLSFGIQTLLRPSTKCMDGPHEKAVLHCRFCTL